MLISWIPTIKWPFWYLVTLSDCILTWDMKGSRQCIYIKHVSSKAITDIPSMKIVDKSTIVPSNLSLLEMFHSALPSRLFFKLHFKVNNEYTSNIFSFWVHTQMFEFFLFLVNGIYLVCSSSNMSYVQFIFFMYHLWLIEHLLLVLLCCNL